MTRWRADPWARGSYSFVAVGASGSDYDVLATPVSSPTNSSNESNGEQEKSKVPRLFFAGEYHSLLSMVDLGLISKSDELKSEVKAAAMGFEEYFKIATQWGGSPETLRNTIGNVTHKIRGFSINTYCIRGICAQ